MGYKDSSIGNARRKGEKHNKQRNKKKEKRKEISKKISSGATKRIAIGKGIEDKYAMRHDFSISKDKAAGVCYYIDHPGLLTQGDILRHHCLEKGCCTFKPILTHPMWKKLTPITDNTADTTNANGAAEEQPLELKSKKAFLSKEFDQKILTAFQERINTPSGKFAVESVVAQKEWTLKNEDNKEEPSETSRECDAYEQYIITNDAPEDKGIDGQLEEIDRLTQEIADQVYENVFSVMDQYFAVAAEKEERHIKNRQKKENIKKKKAQAREEAARKEAEQKEREEAEEKLKEAVLGNKDLYPGRNFSHNKNAKFTQKKINGRAATYKHGGVIVNKRLDAKKRNQRIAKRTEEMLDYEYEEFFGRIG